MITPTPQIAADAARKVGQYSQAATAIQDAAICLTQAVNWLEQTRAKLTGASSGTVHAFYQQERTRSIAEIEQAVKRELAACERDRASAERTIERLRALAGEPTPAPAEGES